MKQLIARLICKFKGHQIKLISHHWYTYSGGDDYYVNSYFLCTRCQEIFTVLPGELTIRIRAKDVADIDWIWESHRKQELNNGMVVTAIAKGDMFKQLTAYEDLVKFYEDRADTDYLDLEEEKKLYELNKTLQEGCKYEQTN